MNRLLSLTHGKWSKQRLAHYKTCRICQIHMSIKALYLILQVKHCISNCQAEAFASYTNKRELNGIFIERLPAVM